MSSKRGTGSCRKLISRAFISVLSQNWNLINYLFFMVFVWRTILSLQYFFVFCNCAELLCLSCWTQQFACFDTLQSLNCTHTAVPAESAPFTIIRYGALQMSHNEYTVKKKKMRIAHKTWRQIHCFAQSYVETEVSSRTPSRWRYWPFLDLFSRWDIYQI